MQPGLDQPAAPDQASSVPSGEPPTSASKAGSQEDSCIEGCDGHSRRGKRLARCLKPESESESEEFKSADLQRRVLLVLIDIPEEVPNRQDIGSHSLAEHARPLLAEGHWLEEGFHVRCSQST